jgi:hypothetical protein
VRLHGRFRDGQVIGDLLVEQPLRQHHQHAHLLRRQRREPPHQIGGLGIGAGLQIDIRRRPHPAFQHACDRGAHLLDAEGFWDEPGGTEFHAAPDHRRIVVCRDHDHRHARILRAQIHQAGETAHARHGQVEQHQIDIAATIEQRDRFVERAGLRDTGIAEQPGHGFAHCATKQRVVIGNNERVGGTHGQGLRIARRAAGTRQFDESRLHR